MTAGIAGEIRWEMFVAAEVSFDVCPLCKCVLTVYSFLGRQGSVDAGIEAILGFHDGLWDREPFFGEIRDGARLKSDD